MMRVLIFVLFLQFLLFRIGVAKTTQLDADSNDSTKDTSEADFSDSGDESNDDDDTDADDKLVTNRVNLKSSKNYYANKLTSHHHRVKPKSSNERSDEDQDSYRNSQRSSSHGNRYNSRRSFENHQEDNHRSSQRRRNDSYERNSRHRHTNDYGSNHREESYESNSRDRHRDQTSRGNRDRHDSRRDSNTDRSGRYEKDDDNNGRRNRHRDRTSISRGNGHRYDRRRHSTADRSGTYEKDDDHHNGKHSTHRRRSPPIRRAPVLMPSGLLKNITIPTDSKIWACDKKPKLHILKPDGKMGQIDYAIVKSEIELSWSPAFTGQIVKIEKVVSTCLWNRYKYRKRQVTDEVKVSNERMLFFGAASETILELTQRGFDERNLTMQSTSWGAGFLLPERSDQANGYTTVQPDGNRLMLICRVTLGTTQVVATGNPMAHPPVGFQSVKGTVNGQSVYVLYRGEQVYPEYLITYK